MAALGVIISGIIILGDGNMKGQAALGSSPCFVHGIATEGFVVVILAQISHDQGRDRIAGGGDG